VEEVRSTYGPSSDRRVDQPALGLEGQAPYIVGCDDVARIRVPIAVVQVPQVVGVKLERLARRWVVRRAGVGCGQRTVRELLQARYLTSRSACGLLHTLHLSPHVDRGLLRHQHLVLRAGTFRLP